MTIRPAEIADVPTIVKMGVRFLRESSYHQHIGVNPEQIAALAHVLIARDDAVLLLALGAEPVGMIGAVLVAHPISARRMATEMFWWVEPEARATTAGIRLLRSTEAWAKGMGAEALQMVAPVPRVEEFYKRSGYTYVETLYQRTL